MNKLQVFLDYYSKEHGYDDFDQFLHEIEDIDKAKLFIEDMMTEYSKEVISAFMSSMYSNF